MRLLLLTLIAIIITAVACQKKSIPVITDRKAPPPSQTSFTYPPIANVTADTIKGKRLFNSSCNRCHGLPVVSQFTDKVWDGYLASMFPRTGLNTEEAFHVRAWVLSNAKK